MLSGNRHHDFTSLPWSETHEDGRTVKRFRVFSIFLAKKSFFILSPMIFFKALWSIGRFRGRIILHYWEIRGLTTLYAVALKLIFRGRLDLVHSAFGQLHSSDSFLRKVYDPLFYNLTISANDYCFVQNESERAQYLDRLRGLEHCSSPEAKIKFIPLHIASPGYDYPFPKKTSERKRLAEKYGLQLRKLNIISLSRFNERKGLARIYDLVSRFADSKRVDTSLIFAGHDEGFKSELYRFQEESKGSFCSVSILENIYGESRFDLYYLADIFFGLPIIYEETMLASIEAMRVGTPAVVSKEATIPCVDRFGGAIELMDPLSEVDEAVETIIKNYDHFSGCARNCSIEIFGREQVFSRIRESLDIS